MFTAEDAFEASEDGDPIMLAHDAAARICRDHDADLADFLTDCAITATHVDAAVLLGWLGY